jgi:hypothetical protein
MKIKVPESYIPKLKGQSENGRVIHYENSDTGFIEVVHNLEPATLAISSNPTTGLTAGVHVFGNGNITMKNLHSNMANVCDGLMERLLAESEVTISINLDVLDPSVLDIGQEYGGLTARELIYILQRLSMLRNLKKIQLKQENSADRLIIKLIREIAGHIR